MAGDRGIRPDEVLLSRRTWEAHTPVYEISVNGGALADFWLEFGVACLLCLVPAPILLAVGRGAETRLAWAG